MEWRRHGETGLDCVILGDIDVERNRLYWTLIEFSINFYTKITIVCCRHHPIIDIGVERGWREVGKVIHMFYSVSILVTIV